MEREENGQESLADSTDFFSSPPMNLAEEESYFMKISPTSSSQNEAPLVYEFDVDDGHYADLGQCFHFVTFKILKEDRRTEIGKTGAGNTYKDEEKVAPISYFSNTLFANAELYLNNDLIESANNLYPYKSYLQAFLSNPVDAKNNQMQVAGYYPDTGETVHGGALAKTMHSEECKNTGLHDRFNLCAQSKEFSCFAPLHLDFGSQNRYVLNKTEIKIRLTRAKSAFGLIAGDDTKEYALVISDSYIMLRMVRPRESLRLAIEESLANNDAKYPMKQCEMRFFTNSGTSTAIVEPNIYSGHLPTRVAIGLVATSHLDGHLYSSPFFFNNFDVKTVDLKVNGKTVTTDPLKINIANNDYVLPFSMLYRNTGGLFQNESIISYKDYKNGNFLYVFDLTDDGDHESGHFHQPSSGIISLDIRTGTAPTVPVSVICMFEREVIVTCDKERKYDVMG